MKHLRLGLQALAYLIQIVRRISRVGNNQIEEEFFVGEIFHRTSISESYFQFF
jgi:hypothetical protein